MIYKFRRSTALILIFLMLISTTVFVFGENTIGMLRDGNPPNMRLDEMVDVIFYSGDHGKLAYIDGTGQLVTDQDKVIISVKKGTPFKQIVVPLPIPDEEYTFDYWDPNLPDNEDPVMSDMEFKAKFKKGAGFVHDTITLSVKDGSEVQPIPGANIHIVGKVLSTDVDFILLGDEVSDADGIADYTHTYRYTIKYTITLPEMLPGNYVIDDFIADESSFKEKHSIFDVHFNYVFTEANVTDITFENNILEFIVHDAPLAWGKFNANLVFSRKPQNNFFITGDDTYEVYIDGLNQFNGLPVEGSHETNYTTVNEYYYDDGFTNNTLVAIKGKDTSGRANIASIKAMYKIGNEYKGTDENWYYLVADDDVYTDAEGRAYHWYEYGYKSNDWKPVTVIDPVPNGVAWNVDDWPYSNNKHHFIWSENYKYINTSPAVRETLIDTPVLFRNMNPSSYGTLNLSKDWVGDIPKDENGKEIDVIVLIKCGDTVKNKVKLTADNHYMASINLPKDVDCIITVEEEPIENYKPVYWVDNKKTNVVTFDQKNECNMAIVNTQMKTYKFVLQKYWINPDGTFVDPSFINIKSVGVGVYNQKKELVKTVQLMPVNEPINDNEYCIWSNYLELTIPADENIEEYYVQEENDLSPLFKVSYPQGQNISLKQKGIQINNTLNAGIIRITKEFDGAFMRSVTVDINKLNLTTPAPKKTKLFEKQIQINGNTGKGHIDVWLPYGDVYEFVEHAISGYKVTYSVDNKETNVINHKPSQLTRLSEIKILNTQSVLYATLSYDKNNPNAIGSMPTESKAIQQTFNLSNNAYSLSGYNFSSWNTKADGSGTAYSNGASFTMPAEDIVLYAQWTVIPSDPPSGGGGGGETIFIEAEETPLGKLNNVDHFAYLQGYPDKTIRPNHLVTRAEASAIFFRLLDRKYKEEVRSNQNEFRDIMSKSWYNKHISTLAKGKIINGYQDGTFRPNNPITRAELAVIASRFDKLELNAKSPFSDTKGHWAEKYIASAAKKGWIEGYINGTFKPDNYITRVELVSFVNNVLGRHVNKQDILSGVVEFKDLNNRNAWYYGAINAATNSYLYENIKNEPGYQKWTKIIKPIIEM